MGYLGERIPIISSNWLALPSPKTNNSLLKNDDLGDYFGKPETRRVGIGRGLLRLVLRKNLRRQENYTKMLQEKDLLLESKDLCGSVWVS